MNLVRVDLRRRGIELHHVRAHDQLNGRERPTDMARRTTLDSMAVLAAINADFFQLVTGENENNQVIGGEWWKGLKVTDSPFDTYDNVHVQFAVDAGGCTYMDRFVLDARAWVRCRDPAAAGCRSEAARGRLAAPPPRRSGRSTTMVVEDTVVNEPTDPTGERAVGNALLVVKKP